MEELSNDKDLTVFNREVTLVCDFELALINAVQLLYGSVQVKCCFFHFVQCIRKNRPKLVNAVKKLDVKRREAPHGVEDGAPSRDAPRSSGADHSRAG